MKRATLPLTGAVLLVAAAALRLPHTRQIFRPEANPFCRTLSPFDGPIFALLEQASGKIPPGARVAVEASSRRPAESAYFALVASGMLPGRDVRSASPPPRDGWRPDFLVVLGSRLPEAPVRPVLRSPEGTVWRTSE